MNDFSSVALRERADTCKTASAQADNEFELFRLKRMNAALVAMAEMQEWLDGQPQDIATL